MENLVWRCTLSGQSLNCLYLTKVWFYFSSDNFIPNIYDTFSGKIYTLNDSFILDDENCLTIWFQNNDLEYFFYIHDPNFFISSINVAIPAISFSHNTGETLISKSYDFCERFVRINF